MADIGLTLEPPACAARPPCAPGPPLTRGRVGVRTMSPSDLVLAVALLSAPPGTPEPVPGPDRWPAIQAALHKTAVDCELLDPREVRYMLSRVEGFDCDLPILRRRHEDLADAPKVAQAGRFPDSDTVNEL